MQRKIKVAIIGVGNCCSSLVQGISYYLHNKSEQVGIMHWDIGGFTPSDLEIVAAFDVDHRKVGRPLSEAIFSQPNNTKIFCDNVKQHDVIVQMGCVLDGISEHFKSYPTEEAIIKAETREPTKDEIIDCLRSSQADILVNFLPVGSKKATEMYVECALEAKVAVVNCIPVFIASDTAWQQKFSKAGIPIIGDDIKAQIGATICHRTLANLCVARGVKITRSYQLNVGGNTDFLNMLNRERLEDKKISKTEAVESVIKNNDTALHTGPSDYVPWLKDNKVCFLRIEGEVFGGVPIDMELRLSVEDSPNSAGVVIDAIRCAKIALLRGEGGAINDVSAYLMKHPPQQHEDSYAHQLINQYIAS